MNEFEKKVEEDFNKKHKNADPNSEDFLEKMPDPISSRKCKGLNILSSITSDLLKKSGGEKEFLRKELQVDLQKIVGEKLSKVMFVHSARFVGKKRLRVIFGLKNPSLSTIISYQKDTLVKGIEEYLGLQGQGVVEVSFKH